jgi:hypothetical protein
MELFSEMLHELRHGYEKAWSKRDTRMDNYPMMSSPFPTLLICITFVFIVKVAGPNFMRDRKPMNIKGFLVIYNLFQVVLSAYICHGVSMIMYDQHMYLTRKTLIFLQSNSEPTRNY